MFELLQAQSIQHQLLRRLWRALARLHGSHLCPPKPTAISQECSDVHDENLTMGCLAKLILGARRFMAESKLGRLGSDFELFEKFISSTTRTTITSQTGTQESERQTEGKRQGQGKGQWTERQGKTCHRASPLVFKRSTAACPDVANLNGTHKSGSQVAGDSDGPQEEGRSRASDTGQRSRCSEQQDSHQQTPQSCDQARRCKDCCFRSETSEIQSPCIMETILGLRHRDLAILHRGLRQGGHQIGGGHHESRSGSDHGARSLGRCQESCHGGGTEGSDRNDRGRGRRLGSHDQNKSGNEGRPDRHAGWLGATQSQNRRSWGRSSPQASKGCRWLQTYCLAAFWWGRSLGLQVNDQWPGDKCGAILKWHHTILSEHNFLSEWQAVDDAVDLSLQLGSWSRRQRSSLVPLPSSRERHRTIDLTSHPSFDENVEIAFFNSNDDPDFFKYHSTAMSLTALSSWRASEGKPWSSRRWRLPRSCGSTLFELPKMSRHDKFLAISGIVDSRCPDPGPRQHRPDQEQNPDLPDPPGRREEERPGRPQERPLHHFPSWVESLWNLLLQHGATEMLEEGPIVYLDSFYISHLHCRKQETNRSLRLDQHYEDWATQIMEVWHDHFDRNSAFEVFLVDPDPPAPITRGTVGTVLISQHPDGRQVAVMTTIANDDIRGPWIKEIAHSFEWMTPHRHVLHQAGVLANCLEMQRQGLGRCEIRLGDFTFPHERPLRLHDGLGLVIDIPMIVTDEIWSSMILPRLQEATRSGPSQTSTVTATEQVPDHTSFMARRPQPRQTRTSTDSTSSSSASTSRSAEPSSQDPQDWRRTAIFTTDGQAQSALLPWHDSTELYARVATAFGVTRGEILQLYQVLERPQDLEQIQVHCMLLQRREEPQPVHILQFILLDLEITEENNILPGIFTRKAAWMPHVITRQSILRILNLESLQQQQPERCRIWHNNQIIDQDRSSPLTFVDGDYLAIYIGDERQAVQLHFKW